jgi:hypothetical protein
VQSDWSDGFFLAINNHQPLKTVAFFRYSSARSSAGVLPMIFLYSESVTRSSHSAGG